MAKAAGMGAARAFGYGLGHVAAAALIDVTRRLFRAVHHEIDVVGRQAGIFDEVQQRQHGSGLAGDVFQQHMSGKILVNFMAATAAAHDLAAAVQGQRMFIVDMRLNFRGFMPGLKAGNLHGTDDGVAFQLCLHGRGKVLFQPDQIKDVADVQQGQKFIFGHDFAVMAVTRRAFRKMLHARTHHRRKGGHVQRADIGQIGRIAAHDVITRNLCRQIGQERGIRLGDPFLPRRRAVMKPQFGCVVEAIGCAPDTDICHMKSLLGVFRSRFEIRDFRGEGNPLISAVDARKAPASPNGHGLRPPSVAAGAQGCSLRWAGRRYASRFTFFKGKTLQGLSTVIFYLFQINRKHSLHISFEKYLPHGLCPL